MWPPTPHPSFHLKRVEWLWIHWLRQQKYEMEDFIMCLPICIAIPWQCKYCFFFFLLQVKQWVLHGSLTTLECLGTGFCTVSAVLCLHLPSSELCTGASAVSCGTSHASAVSTPLRWIFKKRAIKKACHSCRTTGERSESAQESGE